MKKQLAILLSVIMVLTLTPFITVDAAQKRLNMTYLFASSATEPIKYINMTNDSLDQVYPKYFQILNDGKLDVTIPANSKDFVNEMHARNIKVIPFLANNWANGEKMFANSAQIAEQIVKTVNENNLDGINIDIEGLGSLYRDQFTNFIKILNEKLPEGKLLSIAVAPNPWGTNQGWQGFYDYQSLAKYVDFLFVMTYDERGGGSKDNGPVASISFIEKSIKYALKYVAPDKIVLGIPFYGRVWNMEDVGDMLNQNSNRVLGESISLNKIESLLSTYNVKVEYDQESESVKGTFTVKQGDPEYRLKAWLPPLKPGTYEVWYENNASIKAKLQLIHKYNLKGVGSWSLGQEDPSIWTDFRLWLDGLDFKDVGINHWAFNSIAFVKEKQWMNGKNSVTTFKPADSLTRAEAAAILTRVLKLQMKEAPASPYTDVGSAYQWASANIEIVRQHGVMKGTGTTEFSPGKALTRQEMAVILERLIGNQFPESVQSKVMFKDQNDIYPYAYDSIVHMSENYVFSGYDDGTFRPTKEINRAEMAAILERIAKYFPE